MGTEAVSGSVDDILHQHKPGFDRLSSIHAFDKVQTVHLASYSVHVHCTCIYDVFRSYVQPAKSFILPANGTDVQNLSLTI